MSAMMTEATMAHRRKLHPRSQPALPPQLAAVNLHAEGIDVGAEAGHVTDLCQPAHPAYAKGPDADEPQAAARHQRCDGGDRDGDHTGHARWGTRPRAVGAPPE